MRVRQEGENNGGRVRGVGEMEEEEGREDKSNGRKEKEGKALSLSRLKSRISLTWESNLSNPSTHHHTFLMVCPHLEHKLIDHCYRTYWLAGTTRKYTITLFQKVISCTKHSTQ